MIELSETIQPIKPQIKATKKTLKKKKERKTLKQKIITQEKLKNYKQVSPRELLLIKSTDKDVLINKYMQSQIVFKKQGQGYTFLESKPGSASFLQKPQFLIESHQDSEFQPFPYTKRISHLQNRKYPKLTQSLSSRGFTNNLLITTPPSQISQLFIDSEFQDKEEKKKDKTEIILNRVKELKDEKSNESSSSLDIISKSKNKSEDASLERSSAELQTFLAKHNKQIPEPETCSHLSLLRKQILEKNLIVKSTSTAHISSPLSSPSPSSFSPLPTPHPKHTSKTSIKNSMKNTNTGKYNTLHLPKQAHPPSNTNTHYPSSTTNLRDFTLHSEHGFQKHSKAQYRNIEDKENLSSPPSQIDTLLPFPPQHSPITNTHSNGFHSHRVLNTPQQTPRHNVLYTPHLSSVFSYQKPQTASVRNLANYGAVASKYKSPPPVLGRGGAGKKKDFCEGEEEKEKTNPQAEKIQDKEKDVKNQKYVQRKNSLFSSFNSKGKCLVNISKQVAREKLWYLAKLGRTNQISKNAKGENEGFRKLSYKIGSSSNYIVALKRLPKCNNNFHPTREVNRNKKKFLEWSNELISKVKDSSYYGSNYPFQE